MRVFHHVLLKFGHEIAEMQKQKFDETHRIDLKLFALEKIQNY